MFDFLMLSYVIEHCLYETITSLFTQLYEFEPRINGNFWTNLISRCKVGESSSLKGINFFPFNDDLKREALDGNDKKTLDRSA